MNRTNISTWRRTYDKDQLKFYRDDQFREDYTDSELPKKVELVRALIKSELKSVIVTNPIKRTYKVLSLGCGPGSDLVAVVNIFQSVAEKYELPIRRIKCTGVDLFDWPLDAFADRLTDDPIEITDKWVTLDMETYVGDVQSQSREFDFIILSFADVKSKIHFVGNDLPEILSDGGRIFVIDNNIPAVRELEEYGFRYAGRVGASVCLIFANEADSSSDEDYLSAGFATWRL